MVAMIPTEINGRWTLLLPEHRAARPECDRRGNYDKGHGNVRNARLLQDGVRSRLVSGSLEPVAAVRRPERSAANPGGRPRPATAIRRGRRRRLLLDMDRGPRGQRVRADLVAGTPPGSPPGVLRTARRPDPCGPDDRPPVPEPGLRQPGAPGARHDGGEPAARGDHRCAQCREDALPSRARVRRGEHRPGEGRQSEMSGVQA